jgi:predicted ATPase
MYDLPPLSQENINSVKRFITLIDFLYDNKVDFSLHGLTPFDKINEITENIPSFARTFSRLTEMLSKK